MMLGFLRHGSAIARDEWHGPDPERPLTGDGHTQVLEFARACRPLVREMRGIWTSPWCRARQTALLAGRAWGLPVEERAWLAGQALGTVDRIRRLALDGMVLVGDEPDLGQLLGTLAGGQAMPLRTASLAIMEGEPVPGGMILRLLLDPVAALAR